MLTEEVFVKMVKKILKRKENLEVKKLIFGDCDDNKSHKTENWLQVEIYKELKKRGCNKVSIETHSCDIIFSDGSVKKAGLELKMTPSSVEACHIESIRELLVEKGLNRAYLIIVYLLKSKQKKHKDWLEEFQNRAVINKLLQGEEVNKRQYQVICSGEKALIIYCLDIK